MTLFPKQLGTIELPPLPERKVKVGGNWVVQSPFRGASSRARIAPSHFKGHDLITTELTDPYREVLIRHKGARKIRSHLPVVTASPPLSYDEQPTEFTLQWDSLGQLETYADTPEKVLESWVNIFDFRTEDEKAGRAGLRTPQIAALHAISAHFAVGTEFEPAIVVLPTGTGKTETMLATQVYRRLNRTLVLVPSDALRSQISGKFISLGVLPDATVVPHEIACPRVAVIATGIKSVDDAREILKLANVIVSLPNSLEASNQEAVAALIEGSTDLFVDEAHHVSASTWLSIRDRFEGKRILQFTATPFRRDTKRGDGKVIFNYKLGDAQAAGYYRPINLQTVEEYGDVEARDRAIAEKAIAALRHDRDDLKLDHLVMARTKSKERAETIGALYAELAPDLKPVVVYSGSGRLVANREAMAKLFDRGPNGSRIVVCVDMLGEGFDLPYLKIAALHDNHKSLAVTLQFIGRFTRKGDPTKIGDATVVTNIADPEAERKLADLYAEGADWDRIIQRLSEERIAEELRLQDVVYGLKGGEGTLHDQLSLWNLRPALSTQFFRTKCDTWTPTAYQKILPNAAESWFSYSEDDEVLVAVICRADEVGWGNYQNVLNTIYDLLIVRWDKDAGALCLYSSDYQGVRSERLAQIITDDDTQLVSGAPIFNILNNVELPLVKSLGSSRIGAISFTSYFGPNVTEGLALIEKAQSELNNLACLGYENGERVIWGGTQRRGKVWQQKSGTIAEWIAWTKATWAKVTAKGEEQANVIRDFLKPEKLSAAYGSPPIAVQWGEQAQQRFNDRQSVVFGVIEASLYEVDLELGHIGPNGEIHVRIVSDKSSAEYSLTIREDLPGGYRHDHVSGPPVRFQVGNGEPIELPEYLLKDPFVVHYADGTYSYNCYHIPANLSAGLFDRDRLEAWDWTGIPLNKESMHKIGDQATIQYRTAEMLKSEYDVVFNDDGCGEAADLVCLKDIDEETIKLCLVHCKGAHGGRISQDITNFYTVCGQAQKSVATKHAGLPTLYRDLKRRQEIWVREGANRFIKGDMKQLAYFKEKARRSKSEFDMVLVQPGGSAATITDDALRLLATTELYLFKTTQAKLRVIVSP
ncbi:DEAD/DEAH box helicase [Rhizobium rhizogenes]|uniref:DEAD/DEAH box helicase n=1 Tax=Rhizobium rhizogenes TaxID=359 RepID=UPI00193E06A7|nr:DEAD/DEAH box helicase family protein [Rhizobium rhizogenes]QRM40489.1 DEAD/DEAH box helicase [Rhizobium rhizogenes]